MPAADPHRSTWVGKTRLAIELGRAVAGEFPDAVWLVEMAPLSDADAVVLAVSSALAVRELGRPITSVDGPLTSSTYEAVVLHLRVRRVLRLQPPDEFGMQLPPQSFPKGCSLTRVRGCPPGPERPPDRSPARRPAGRTGRGPSSGPAEDDQAGPRRPRPTDRWGARPTESHATDRVPSAALSQPPRRLPVAAPSLRAARAVRTAVRPRRRPESLGIAGSLPAHLFPADGLSEPGNLDSAAQLLDHFGEVIIGCLRSKNSVSPTLSLFISSMLACNSGGSSLRSPSRASASEMKYITMV
jgi:hypothetical protein